MHERDRYDDSDLADEIQRARRTTRLGWAAIAGTTWLLAMAVVALIALTLVVAVAIAYSTAAMD
ncbi:hypothetical protein [Streptomyces ossamyceticus]|jgi:hypothetical protein|uniref:hypothetical protein n=1 Tax=Streptomyces ossamyceticus TaxID=249581 RepID=UPI0006E3E06A|nr:hypothetical protein [Streptomyces ossamyceticus]